MDQVSSLNITSNASNGEATSNLSLDHSLEFKVFKIIIYVVIFLLSIIGNGLVISVIRNDKRMRGTSHILILNLACCDFITPTISIPFDLAYEEMHYAWPFGDVMCRVLWPCQTLTATSSVFILTAICIDRYRALVYPFKVRWAGKFCLMVFSVYTLAVVVVVPYILVLNFSHNGCMEKWPNPQKVFRQVYTIALFLFQYALPLAMMMTLYSITLRSLFNNAKSLSETNTPRMQTRDPKNRERQKIDQSIQELRKEQHLKVTKMFITVVIVFAVSMFPNQALWLWVDFGTAADSKYFSVASIICRIFTYSNSVLNPFIYGLYSKDFRSGYKRAGRRVSYLRKDQGLYHPFTNKHKTQLPTDLEPGGVNKNTSRCLVSARSSQPAELIQYEQRSDSSTKNLEKLSNSIDVSPIPRTSKYFEENDGDESISVENHQLRHPGIDALKHNEPCKTKIKRDDNGRGKPLMNDGDTNNDLVLLKDMYNHIANPGTNNINNPDLNTEERVTEYFDELAETQC